MTLIFSYKLWNNKQQIGKYWLDTYRKVCLAATRNQYADKFQLGLSSARHFTAATSGNVNRRLLTMIEHSDMATIRCIHFFFSLVPFFLGWNVFCFYSRSHLCGFLARSVLLVFPFRSLSALSSFSQTSTTFHVLFFSLAVTLSTCFSVDSVQMAKNHSRRK